MAYIRSKTTEEGMYYLLLDQVQMLGCFESVQRYDIKGKVYIETLKKYYFSDLGFRNARINFRQFEQTHSMGNVIRKQFEVAFVCNLGSLKYYIQSAYSLPDEAKRMQEIRPFRKIDDSFKKIVIIKDIVKPHYDEHGILTLNIYDFLLDPTYIKK